MAKSKRNDLESKYDRPDQLWGLPGVEVAPGGVFIDRDYEGAVAAETLVFRSDAAPVYTQCCIDVHCSAEAFQLARDRTRRQSVHPRRDKDDPDTPYFLLRAGAVLVVKTEERFEVPADVQGQVSPKAQLTTLGLSFPTTHVDPGYDQELYLPVMNMGPFDVKVVVGRAIGKVEFQRLARPVAEPWSGHTGFSDFARDLIVEVNPPREQIRRLQRLSWLFAGWVILLTLAVLAMLFQTPLHKLARWLESSEFVAAVAVAVVSAGLISLAGLSAALVRKGIRSWREEQSP